MKTHAHKLKVAIGGIWHETNTFASSTTEFDSFECLEGQELLNHFNGTRTPLGGFIDYCRRQPGIELIPTFYASAVPSGMVSRQAYENLATRLVTAVKKAAPDVILLDLHGAMVVEPCRDIESEFLVRLRGRFGRIPIGAVLDFHANISEEFVFLVDFMAGYDTYPHVDLYERGLEVAERTLQIARKQISPAKAIVQPPLLIPPQAQLTDQQPMAQLMALAHEMENRKDVISVTVAGGFPYSDVPQAGPSVVVTTNNNQALAQQLANELAGRMWEMRDAFAVQLTDPSKAIQNSLSAGKFPTVLVDSADNIGGGSPGDGTVVLKNLLDQRAKGAVVSIADAEALKTIAHSGVGSVINVRLGGKADSHHGPPVDVNARVLKICIGDFDYKGSYMTARHVTAGLAAVLDAGGVLIVVRERKVLPFDSEELRVLGIEPSRCRIIVVKSALAWRAAYGGIARNVIEVDTPGICSAHLSTFTYKNLRRPIAPLDSGVEWAPPNNAVRAAKQLGTVGT